MEENKRYLRPDYSEEPDFDIPPDDADESVDESNEDSVVESYLDNQEKLNKKIMQTTPYNGSTWNSGPSWGNPGTQQQPSWGQSQNNSNPWNRPSGTPSWGNSGGNTWGNSGSTWNTPGSNTWSGGTTGEKKELDRTKKVIFCDVLDCLIETLQSNGRPGLIPRGIYDMRLRFEVWDKLKCFNPERIYAMIPRALIMSSNGADSWKALLEYVSHSLSEYLRLPFSNCQILTQTVIGQAKEQMMLPVVGKLNKKDIIHIGLESGLSGQSNRDIFAAKECEIDYIDLGQFMSLYL